MEHRDPALFGASVTAAAMATAGCPWTAVLAGWGIGAIITALAPEERTPGRGETWIWLAAGVPVLAAVLLGADGAFPEDGTFPFVSLAMLALLLRAAAGRGSDGPANILGLALLPVLAAPVVYGLGDVRWAENQPTMPAWEQVLRAVGTSTPWWCLRSGKKCGRTWTWFGASAAICLGISLLTWGVLGGALAGEIAYPLYRTVQTIRVFGVLQRLEAFFAAALLMGSMILLLLVGRRVGEILRQIPPKISLRRKNAAFFGLVFALEWAVRRAPGEFRAAAGTVFWGFLTAFALGIVFLRIFAKKT